MYPLIAQPPLEEGATQVIKTFRPEIAVIGAAGALGGKETVAVISRAIATEVQLANLMVAVRTVDQAAEAGAKYKYGLLQVKPKYGHELTAKPVPLSTKEIVLEPHVEVPSAEPQTMLMVSGMLGLNVIV